MPPTSYFAPRPPPPARRRSWPPHDPTPIPTSPLYNDYSPLPSPTFTVTSSTPSRPSSPHPFSPSASRPLPPTTAPPTPAVPNTTRTTIILKPRAPTAPHAPPPPDRRTLWTCCLCHTPSDYLSCSHCDHCWVTCKACVFIPRTMSTGMFVEGHAREGVEPVAKGGCETWGRNWGRRTRPIVVDEKEVERVVGKKEVWAKKNGKSAGWGRDGGRVKGDGEKGEGRVVETHMPTVAEGNGDGNGGEMDVPADE